MTPDPSTVSAQITAIQEHYPDWFRDKQALAEAAACWGGGCNEYGVFTTREPETIARLSGSCHAEVRIAQSGNGLFSFGIRCWWGMGGSGHAPSVWGEPFATRVEARRAAIKELVRAIEEHGGGATNQQRLLLEAVRKADVQRGLFD